MEGGENKFLGEGLHSPREVHSALRFSHSWWSSTRSSTHSWGEVVGRNHTKWASIEVCATKLHFVLDLTEVLLGPGDATLLPPQKAADGGQNPLESAEHSEWTKQSQNGIMSEREQPTHHRVNALWCGNNSPSTAHFSPGNELHNKLTQK